MYSVKVVFCCVVLFCVVVGLVTINVNELDAHRTDDVKMNFVRIVVLLLHCIISFLPVIHH